MRVTKKQQREKGARFQRLYLSRCEGIQISIWDMGNVSDVGMAGIDAGKTDEEVAEAIHAFVQTIRKN